MIAIDTSSFVGFFKGEKGSDIDGIEFALQNKIAVFPPVVIAEMLSDSKLPPHVKELLNHVKILEIKEGYWHRVGTLRAGILSKGNKARLADTLVAQACLDHNIPLITRDKDFLHFAKHTNLKLFSHL